MLLKLSIGAKAKSKPFASLVAFNFAKTTNPKSSLVFEDSASDPVLSVDDSESFAGNYEVATKLCKIANIFNSDKNVALMEMAKERMGDARSLPQNCDFLNSSLTSQGLPFFTANEPEAADIFLWDSLKQNKRWRVLKKDKSKIGKLAGWFDCLEGRAEFSDAVKALANANKPKEAKPAKNAKNKTQGKVNQNYFEGLRVGIEKSMMGKVVTRFPPEPSGFLHIGHVKAAILNSKIAEIWGGKMILRFDDTNPTKEKGEYVENITRDLARLNISYWRLTHTSDYFALLFGICTQLIQSGRAFAEDTPREIMKEERMALAESKNRGNSVEKNMQMWERMQNGERLTIRLKLDMKSPNGTLRDPVIYRCNDEMPHLRTGDKYKVYPTYDFSIPVVDTVEGVTHSFRSAEYLDRGAQYKQVWGSIFKPLNREERRSVFEMALEHSQDDERPKLFPDFEAIAKKPVMPKVKTFSRLNLMNTLLSKRKLGWFVDTGKVSGWDDPRFPTVQGILRRGLTVEGLRDFILAIGFSVKENLMDWDKLWSINKRILDPKAHRYMALANDLVTLKIRGATLEPKMANLHPKHPEIGQKQIFLSDEVLIERADALCFKEDTKVTLVEWGNVLIEKIDLAANVIHASASASEDYKHTMKVTWLADLGSKLAPITLITLKPLIDVPKLEDGMNLEDHVTENSWVEETAVGDPNLASLKKGAIIQIQRKGFAIVDKALEGGSSDRLVFIMIPDSRKIVKKKHVPHSTQ